MIDDVSDRHVIVATIMTTVIAVVAWSRTMTWQERIVIDPDILVGKPTIKGTRLAVEFIIDLLAQGWSEDEILRNYPGITIDDIHACLSYASEGDTPQEALANIQEAIELYLEPVEIESDDSNAKHPTSHSYSA